MDTKCIIIYIRYTWNASEHHQYDDKGNMIETSYYGTAGQLRIISGGYAGWTSKHDEYGNERIGYMLIEA